MLDLDKLTSSIQQHEGLRLKPYTDTSGETTIGYGRNLSNVGISQDEANYLLGNDIQSAIGTAQTQVWWPVVGDGARARAFIEIGFNIGFAAMSGFHNAINAAIKDDWATCSAEFLNSLWARQVGQRAETLATMILTDTDPS